MTDPIFKWWVLQQSRRRSKPTDKTALADVYKSFCDAKWAILSSDVSHVEFSVHTYLKELDKRAHSLSDTFRMNLLPHNKKLLELASSIAELSGNQLQQKVRASKQNIYEIDKLFNAEL